MKDYKNGTEFGYVDAPDIMKAVLQNPPPKSEALPAKHSTNNHC